MASTSDSLPTDLAAAHAMIIAQREALIVAQAKAQNAEAEARHRALLIEQMKFTIAKLRHEKFGQSAERGVLLEQLEFRLADMEEDASEAETKAQMAAAASAGRRDLGCRIPGGNQESSGGPRAPISESIIAGAMPTQSEFKHSQKSWSDCNPTCWSPIPRLRPKASCKRPAPYRSCSSRLPIRSAKGWS